MNTQNVILGLIAVLVVSGVGCQKQLQKATLPPIEVSTNLKGDQDDNIKGTIYCDIDDLKGTSCLFDHHKLNIDPLAVLVGYRNTYDPGTQPMPCWQWHDCIWRGYIKFEPKGFKDVVSATLRWNTATKGSAQTCAKQLFIANEPWDKDKYTISGEEIVTTGGLDKGEIQIGPIVRDWVTGKRPNHGLFFVGPNEKLESKTNKECRTQLSKFSLEITYSVSVIEWPK